ncbi:MAG TPA: hypothetical protein VNU22_08770 [Candidatus Acidoferrum sp.]|jgi:hypothetical protein|nr:hypothetical protein [Candidatus Acidoferrum sp.]
MGTSRKKIDAIYELRTAAENKALAEKALEDEPVAERRDQLLRAQIKLEEKTMEAIEVCHDCGGTHSSDEAHEKRKP